MFWIFLSAVCISSNINLADASCYSQESCLIDQIFETVGYDSHVRPAETANDQIVINSTLYVRSLGGIDEKNEIMTVVGYFSLQWWDAFLKWNVSDSTYGGVEALVFFAEDIWLPDVAIVNSVDSYYKSTYKEDFRLIVTADGHVYWEFGGIFKTSCSLDISNYPFDKQECGIELQNWAYFESLVDLQFSEVPILTTTYEKNSLWEVKGVSFKRQQINNLGVNVPRLTYKLELKRKTLYYMFNIIAPIILISGVTLAMFWVPPGCGEKLGLGITVLLAFSVFQIIIMDNTPVNSDVTPKISQVVIFVMCMATISVLSSMFTVTLDLQSSCSRLPKILRIIAFKYLAKVFFLTAEIPDIPEENAIGPEQEADAALALTEKAMEIRKLEKGIVAMGGDSELGEVLKELKKITGHIKEKEHSESIVDEWKLFAKIVDRLLFWMCLITFVIYFVYMAAVIADKA